MKIMLEDVHSIGLLQNQTLKYGNVFIVTSMFAQSAACSVPYNYVQV